ncbi:hypothetical protein PGB90_000230 [Kerria lacca]
MGTFIFVSLNSRCPREEERNNKQIELQSLKKNRVTRVKKKKKKCVDKKKYLRKLEQPNITPRNKHKKKYYTTNLSLRITKKIIILQVRVYE